MRRLFCLAVAVFLAACGDTQKQPETIGQTASAASAATQGASSAAAAILNTPQQADILTTSKQAMASAAASDWSAYTPPLPPQMPTLSASAASGSVALPESCEQYFRRVDACFAEQGEDAAALRALNQDARNELAAAASAPAETECQALNSSFNAVAANLGCR